MADRLEEAYRKSIDNLFSEANKCSKEKLLLTLVGIPIPSKLLPLPWDKVKSFVSTQQLYTLKLSMKQAYESHRYFNQAIQDKQLNCNHWLKAKLMLIASFDVLGADYWHFILGNTLKTIIGEDLVGNLFMQDSLADKISGIKGLLRKCEKKGINLDIGNTYFQIWNEDIRTLRNAFSHSRYFLSPEGGHLTIVPRIPEIKKSKKNKPEKSNFNFTEIQQIYNRTRAFLKLFHDKAQEVTQSFENEQITINERIYWIQLLRKPKVESYKKLHQINGTLKYANGRLKLLRGHTLLSNSVDNWRVPQKLVQV